MELQNRSFPRFPVGAHVFRTVALLACFLAAVTAVHADPVDDLIRAEMEKRHIPGLSLAVVHKGKVVKAQGYGFANLEHRAPATPDTVFQLASVTKQFTATAVMQLVEAGKIQLDDKVSQHLTDLPAAWKDVTVRQLLNHTSGIKSYTAIPNFAQQLRKDFTPTELLGLVKDSPMDFAPGSKYQYNNTGYFLLGLLIEKVSGKTYGTFLSERIFEPLGMNNTRVNDLTVVIPNRASGYTLSGQTIRNGEYVSPTQPYAAGALVSTIQDMVRWNSALDTEKLLKRSSMEQMLTPTRLSDGKTQGYGFGWQLGVLRGHKQMAHGGGIPGFSTYILRLPDDALSVIVLCNQEAANASKLAEQVAATYIPALTPPVRKPIADPEPEVTKRLQEIASGLIKGKAQEADFTPGMWKVLTPEQLAGGAQVLTALGPLKSFELLDRTVENDIRKLEYRLLLGETTVYMRFALTKDGKIASAGFQPQ